ncbi:MAG: type II toxin-antitoxin system VapC family toxin [Actinomycetota bacterium]
MVDAGVLYELLAPGPREDAVQFLILEPNLTLFAPDLALVETASALRKRHLREEEFTARHMRGAIENLLELGVGFVPSATLIEQSVEFVDVLTSYDACYVVLARALGLPLLTFDERLARSAPSDVEVSIPVE